MEVLAGATSPPARLAAGCGDSAPASRPPEEACLLASSRLALGRLGWLYRALGRHQEWPPPSSVAHNWDQARRREEVTKSQTQGPRAFPERRRPSIRPCSEPLGTTAPAAPGAQPVDPPTYAAL